jgi:hypothetical protein
MKNELILKGQLKTRTMNLERDMKVFKEKFEDAEKERLRLKGVNDFLNEEKNQMKVRLAKLKARRGKDLDLKICKSCGQDFSDRENYNWSCRTHKSVWSGEMWWCCGKKRKDALGCQMKKHEAKNDDDEEDQV